MTTRTPDLDTRLLTIEEFERLPDDGWRLELVRGQVVREPPAEFDHGDVAIGIGSLLRKFVDENALGAVVGTDSRTVTIYRSREEIRLIAADGEIDGGDVLPGFRCKVSELFGR